MVTLSAAAAEQLRRLVGQSDAGASPTALRVFVQAGGCSGFSYGLGLDDSPPGPDDEISRYGELTIYVDAFSAPHLDGAEVDYTDALMGGGFTINNPQAVKTCGCGTSFQTADGAGTAASCSA